MVAWEKWALRQRRWLMAVAYDFHKTRQRFASGVSRQRRRSLFVIRHLPQLISLSAHPFGPRMEGPCPRTFLEWPKYVIRVDIESLTHYHQKVVFSKFFKIKCGLHIHVCCCCGIRQEKSATCTMQPETGFVLIETHQSDAAHRKPVTQRKP
jgi:hypothetical protein